MIYTKGWIARNLGITRETIQYYEDQGLLKACGRLNTRNNRIEYEEKDVDKIWSIKVLRDIGYTIKEIKDIIHNPSFDFYASITKKAEQLEEEVNKKTACLEFVKTIKHTGRIPVINQLGCMKYEDFINYVKESWNIYADPDIGPYMRMVDKLNSKESNKLNPEDLKKFAELSEDIEKKMELFGLHGYFQVISDMREMDPASDTVQSVVGLLHKYSREHFSEVMTRNNESYCIFAAQLISLLRRSDTAKMYEEFFGKDGCMFIEKALIIYTSSRCSN